MKHSTKLVLREQLKAAHSWNPHPKLLDECILNYLTALDSPRALTVWLLYSSGEHDQLALLEINPLDYATAESFRSAYCASKYLSKADFLQTTWDKEAIALEKFSKAEEQCALVNRRFKDLSLDPLFKGSSVWLLNATVRKIDEILNERGKNSKPDDPQGLNGEELVSKCGWGPGASSLLRGDDVSAETKFRLETGITKDLADFIRPWFAMAYPSWAASGILEKLTMCEGGMVTTVPKNSKTDRVIAIEPGFNIWFQKGVGKVVRRRLLSHGLDIKSKAAPRNQTLARKASITGEYATVDFSAASDTISREVVRILLPSDWFALLDVTRSKFYSLGTGNWLEAEKFSSMGNGFTFELETLIFYAAACSCCEYLKIGTREVSVYGDDVILPSPAYQLYTEFCSFLGFTVNPQKSFSDGCFRESCGAHFYNGVDTKPLFLKERIRDVTDLYKNANLLLELSRRWNNFQGRDKVFSKCWHHLIHSVPLILRLGIPLGKGDGGFQMDFDEATPATSLSVSTPRAAGDGIEGFRYHAIVLSGVMLESDDPAVSLARLWRLDSDLPTDRSDYHFGLNCDVVGMGNFYPLRNRVRIRIKTNLLIACWPYIGPFN